MRTKGYGGRTLKKKIRVYTNDTEQPVSTLVVKGTVKKFANISPSRVILNGEVGTALKASVEISPATEDLFDIVEAKADGGKDIRISLTEAKKADGKAYVLTVENTQKNIGRYRDTIRLRTTSNQQKEFTIPVYLNIKAKEIADITPSGTIQLKGRSEDKIKASVKIVPKKGFTFDIVEAKADSGEHIHFTLTEPESTDDKVYNLTIENTKKSKGRYQDTIRILTTSKVQGEIPIRIWGDVRGPELVSIKPKQLSLRGSVGKRVRGSVSIVPKGKTPLSITEVKPRNGTNIKWDLNEVKKSGEKAYVLTVENLKKEKGRYHDVIKLKTDNKDLPVIRVRVSVHLVD